MNAATIARLVSSPEQIPRLLAIAMRKAVLNPSGVSVVITAGDVALKPAPGCKSPIGTMPRSPSSRRRRKAGWLLALLSNIALMCGSGCARRAHEELVALAAN